jgi:predicted ATPase
MAMGTIMQGWALAEQGQGEEGIIQIRQEITARRTAGEELQVPYCLALLAEAYEKVGQVEEGLTVLAEALAMVNKNGERWWEAELYRLKGTLTLQKFQASGSKFQVTNPQLLTPNSQAEAEAEAYFHTAIEIARRQQAKSLELRAVMNLARLWQSQGTKREAHVLLSKIYGWFTEGFDTKDLQEAKALLEGVSRTLD